MSEAKALPYEQAVARLEEIVGLLERGEQSLEEALALFQEGVLLARECTRQLDEAERRIEQLLEDSDGTLRTEPFDLEEGA